VDSSFGVPLRSRVCEVGSWFLGLVALQWLRGLGQLELVSRRRVLEAVFVLLKYPSPSRRMFYRLPFTPPSLVRHIGPLTFGSDFIMLPNTNGTPQLLL
jgi:hypothetical protein